MPSFWGSSGAKESYGIQFSDESNWSDTELEYCTMVKLDNEGCGNIGFEVLIGVGIQN